MAIKGQMNIIVYILLHSRNHLNHIQQLEFFSDPKLFISIDFTLVHVTVFLFERWFVL